MKVKVLADSELFVQYGFVYLDSGVGGWDEDVDQRAGQRNGLAGAAQPGFVLLTTGTSTGDVSLRIEQYRKAPPLDDRWDEVVEVSCDLREPRLEVTSFDREIEVRSLRRNGPHRVRYSVARFDDEQERRDHEVALDRYLVQLWPAPMGPDAIIKQTSGRAAYWHEHAQTAEPNQAPDEQAQAERAADEARQSEEETEERELTAARRLFRWGGREPSVRLLGLDPDATQLAVHHRDLVDEIEDLPPTRQRGLALEVTRRACADDHDSPVDWVPALDALEGGQPLPAPFGDEDALDAQLFGDPGEMTVEVVAVVGPVRRQPIHTGVSAAAAVRGAADPDPFAAALRAVEAASWSAVDEDAFFAQVRALLR